MAPKKKGGKGNDAGKGKGRKRKAPQVTTVELAEPTDRPSQVAVMEALVCAASSVVVPPAGVTVSSETVSSEYVITESALPGTSRRYGPRLVSVPRLQKKKKETEISI